MFTVIAIILADVFLFLLYLYQYRQEFGLTVNGSHDMPVLRTKPAKKPAVSAGAASGQVGRSQQIVAKP